ncbi:MAG TPA: pantoate--beta-alanine ligase [bacterium]|nr:pantoate--beta-alanine ligase [bacterium]
MKTVVSLQEMQNSALRWRREGKRIGLVPTMGSLHEGHLSLITRCREQVDIVVVSVFVNPIQFGPQEDFASYPRDLERDATLAEKAGADYIFAPSDQEMYPPDFVSLVKVEKLTERLCGASRPGHFQGVTTVVAKLFNLVQPDVAVFGAKDYQQAAVIRRMVRDLAFPVEIVVAPIVREVNGLAKSSRNQYLSREERAEALILYQSLRFAESLIRGGERQAADIKASMTEMIDSVERSRIDYIEIVHPESLEPVEVITGDVVIALAVFIGKTRLIDNLLVHVAPSS